MGFFSKVLGMDKTIEDMAKAIAYHMREIKDFNYEKDDIKQFLDARGIPNIDMDSGWFKWVITFKTGDELTFRLDYQDEDKQLQAYFDYYANTPLGKLSFQFSNANWYYSVSEYDEVPSLCKTFLKHIELYGVKQR
jgi:hypothetical protein